MTKSDDGQLSPTGRYCEISSTHLTLGTTMLLDRWANQQDAPPLLVAASARGSFVATLAVSEEIPAELLAALRWGRGRAFDFLFIHCDAQIVGVLPVHSW